MLQVGTTFAILHKDLEEQVSRDADAGPDGPETY
jgi:hypothetical protein